MARQRANMSDLLKENQKYEELPSTAEEPKQKENTNTSLTQDPNTSITQNSNEVSEQSTNTLTPQDANTVLPQNTNEVLSQKERMTDKRDRVSFYLNPGQLEKLEEVKIQYRKKTGIRINEQEIIRRAIDRLDVDFLL